MESDLTTVRNIGPATAQALIAAGVPDAEALRAMGADAAYRALMDAGERPHFIGYYALVMGLQGRPWNDCTADEKRDLRVRFDALKHPADDGTPPALAAAMNALGVIAGGRR